MVCGIKLPNYYEAVRLQNEAAATEAAAEKQKLDPENASKPVSTESERRRSEVKVMISGFSFFILAAGTDAYFQSQTYTFGLCGPLALTPAQVSFLCQLSSIGR